VPLGQASVIRVQTPAAQGGECGRFEGGLQAEHPRLPEGSRVGQRQSTLKTWAWAWAWAWASPPEVEDEGEREEVVRPEV